MQKPSALILYGPTGVGKTDLALLLGQYIPVEIVNMDVGQFYTPLSIGTAKPDWKNSSIPHHLFDVFDTPVNCTVVEYRTMVFETINAITQRAKLPILVGGSGFYLRSLLFPPCGPTVNEQENNQYNKQSHEDLWQMLHAIDPQRAAGISKTDTYRLRRALDIWHATKTIPSLYEPSYDCQLNFLLLHLTRDRNDLYTRINERVDVMLRSGWVDEVRKLINTPWYDFIRSKKLIGYTEILDYIESKKEHIPVEVVNTIRQKTRNYAKRQETFWRKLEREIKDGILHTVNLTNADIHLYINELLQQLSSIMEKKYE